MELIRYAYTTAPQLTRLLDNDRCAFLVMRNILNGKIGVPSKVVSDGEQLMLCYTCPPYPAWMWTRADAGDAEMARAWEIMREELPPEAGYCFNVREELAAYIMATEEGRAMRVHRNLNAYSCEKPVPPRREAAGEWRAVGMEMLELAAVWSQAMSEEENLDLRPLDAHTEEIRGFIDRKRLFMWYTPEGAPAAMCAVEVEEDLGYISRVYTAPEHRRRGYAAQLVHGVTKALRAQGILAALCTDASYAPSNACYQQIGFVKQGTVCTIGK